MEKIGIIVDIIEKELQIDRRDIEKSIRKNDLLGFGNYSVLCYMLKSSLKDNPLIIAKKVAEVLQENGIKRCKAMGVYVNIYLAEEIELAGLLKSDKIENKEACMNDAVLIVCKQKGLRKVLDLNALYKLIISEFIGKLYMKTGYEIKSYKPGEINEKTASIKYIMEKMKNKKLITYYNNEKIVELKEDNLPPLIIGNREDNRDSLTLEGLASPLHKASDKNVRKVIIINSKYESMRYKQIYSVMSKIDNVVAEKLENVSLGFIKLNENIKKHLINEEDAMKLLMKRSSEEVVTALGENGISINEVNIEKMALENFIFKFFKSDIGNDIIFDYYESFEVNKNSYLKIKIMEYYLNKEPKKSDYEKLSLNLNSLDLNNNIKLINIMEATKKALDCSVKNYSSGEIIKLIEKIIKDLIEVDENGDENYNANEKTVIYKYTFDILKSFLIILGVSDDMLINKIQKLTVY